MAQVITTIISGAQTGGDQGGLEAAKRLGLITGGLIPKGFRTDNGPKPEFAEMYGIEEDSSSSYPPRTEKNVLRGTGTVIVGDLNSTGCKLTKSLCIRHNRPWLHIYWDSKTPFTSLEQSLFRGFILSNRILVLNVAGNRESKNPGLQKAVSDFIYGSLKDIIS